MGKIEWVFHRSANPLSVKRSAAVSLWALATIALAGGTSLAILHWNRDHEHAAADFHDWVHTNLELSDEQHDRLEPAEQRFEEKETALRARIAKASRSLALAIESEDRESPKIDSALKELNEAQAELQRATLDHFFDMKEVLEPEQFDKRTEVLDGLLCQVTSRGNCKLPIHEAPQRVR